MLPQDLNEQNNLTTAAITDEMWVTIDWETGVVRCSVNYPQGVWTRLEDVTFEDPYVVCKKNNKKKWEQIDL